MLQFRDIEGMLRNVPKQQLAPGTTDQKRARENSCEMPVTSLKNAFSPDTSSLGIRQKEDAMECVYQAGSHNGPGGVRSASPELRAQGLF
jgi:hypothetical protein